jgi:hypothetical protein
MTSTMPGNPVAQPSAEMLKMLNAFLTVQALHVAAFLGIADMLAAGPKSLDELALETKADRSSLHRLLRMLTGPGVFREQADGLFAITPLGATLRSDGSDSVREWALFGDVGGMVRTPRQCHERQCILYGRTWHSHVGVHRRPAEPGRGVQRLDDPPVKAAQLGACGRLRLLAIPPCCRCWRGPRLNAGGCLERSSVS